MTEKAKAYLKAKLKLVAASSPALAALIAFPTESLAFLKMLKEAGFEAGTITVIAGIAYFLRKDVMRIVTELKTGLGVTNTTLQSLSDDYKEHRKQDQIRLDEGQKQFDLITKRFLENDKTLADYGQRFVLIETRLQGVNPTLPPNEIKELAEKVAHEAEQLQSPKDPDLTP